MFLQISVDTATDNASSGMSWAMLTYSAMHEQEGMIQPFAAAKCPFLDISLQQIASCVHIAEQVNAA